MRAAAGGLDAGGAVAAGAGEDGGQVAGETDLAEIVERRLHDPLRKPALDHQAHRRLAVADHAVGDEERAAHLPGEDRERGAAEDEPRLRRGLAHGVRDRAYQSV